MACGRVACVGRAEILLSNQLSCTTRRVLAGTIELPELQRWVRAHYEVVTVDIGRFDKNGQVPAHYGITGRLAGRSLAPGRYRVTAAPVSGDRRGARRRAVLLIAAR